MEVDAPIRPPPDIPLGKEGVARRRVALAIDRRIVGIMYGIGIVVRVLGRDAAVAVSVGLLKASAPPVGVWPAMAEIQSRANGSKVAPPMELLGSRQAEDAGAVLRLALRENRRIEAAGMALLHHHHHTVVHRQLPNLHSKVGREVIRARIGHQVGLAGAL